MALEGRPQHAAARRRLIIQCVLTTHCSAHYSLLTTHYSLLTTYRLLLTTHYSLLTTHYSLLTTHYSPLTTPRYMHSFFWGAAMITSLVPKDVEPTTNVEVTVTCATMFLGLLVSAIVWYCLVLTTSHPTRLTASHLITSHPIPSHHIPSNPNSSHPIPSYPIPSDPIRSDPIRSDPTAFPSSLHATSSGERFPHICIHLCVLLHGLEAGASAHASTPEMYIVFTRVSYNSEACSLPSAYM